jgi:hydrogenase nickel incorporation protein HypA/HybF
MHELSLTQSILIIIDEYAEKHQFDKVNSIKLSFGRLSCVEPMALEFAFNLQSKGTIAEGARLEFDVLPVVIHCFSCEKDSVLDAYSAECPGCKSGEVMIVGGMEELKLLELDVD